MKDYYEILEVNKNASSDMIESAYKILSKKYKNENADNKTINNLNEAYKVLSDAFLREQYDVELEKKEQHKNMQYETNDKKIEDTKEEHTKDNYIEDDNSEVYQPKKKHKFIKDNQFQTTRTLYGLTKDLFKFSKEGLSELKNKKMEREDWIAIGLTFVVLIILGIILWFIPFTNGWMREITVDNPLISWIFKK